MKWEIEFTDHWEYDKNIPEEQRWLASSEELGVVVTAPTKQKAFEEVMTSIRVMVMYANGIKPESPSPVTEAAKESDFVEYMRNARNEFVKVITDYFPHEAKNEEMLELSKPIRVAAEDILICFDQMREKITAAKAATPDSREEGKGDKHVGSNQYCSCGDPSCERFAPVSDAVDDKFEFVEYIKKVKELLLPLRHLADAVRMKCSQNQINQLAEQWGNNAAPLLELLYLPEKFPISDSVKFAEWKDSRYAIININGTNMYYLLADEKRNVVPTALKSIRELYNLFLTEKQKV